VVYVRIPDLEVTRVTQRYTRLDPTGARYLYESGALRAVLQLDNKGLVDQYEGQWTQVRLAAAPGN
jgi:hypothetical protein